MRRGHCIYVKEKMALVQSKRSVHFIHFILNYLYRVKNIQFIREKNCFTMCPVKTEKKNKKKKLITKEIPNTT